MVGKNKAIATRFYEVYNKGNMEIVDGLFSREGIASSNRLARVLGK
jgi:hypothetical protein